MCCWNTCPQLSLLKSGASFRFAELKCRGYGHGKGQVVNFQLDKIKTAIWKLRPGRNLSSGLFFNACTLFMCVDGHVSRWSQRERDTPSHKIDSRRCKYVRQARALQKKGVESVNKASGARESSSSSLWARSWWWSLCGWEFIRENTRPFNPPMSTN